MVVDMGADVGGGLEVAMDERAGRALVRTLLDDGRYVELQDCAGAAIGDVRTNGRRVDARIRSPDGAELLLVVWTTSEVGDEVESVTILPRPPSFDGRPGGLVVVVNGPSSSGKSTLMRTFADGSSTPFAVLDEPWFGRLPARFLAWPETLGPHVSGVLAAVAASAHLGNQFLVSAAGVEQRAFRSALSDVEVVYVALHAPLDVLVERQRRQRDKFGRLAEESIGIHEGWQYDLTIDTSAHSPDDAARLLGELLDESPQVGR